LRHAIYQKINKKYWDMFGLTFLNLSNGISTCDSWECLGELMKITYDMSISCFQPIPSSSQPI